MKFLGVTALSLSVAVSGQGDAYKPVENVVKLLREMRKTITKEQEDDDALHKKMTCWCNSNKKEKTDAIATYDAQIQTLASNIAKHAANIEQLTKDIKEHEMLIEEIDDNMEKQKEQRAAENEEFLASKKELDTSVDSLTRALKILDPEGGWDGHKKCENDQGFTGGLSKEEQDKNESDRLEDKAFQEALAPQSLVQKSKNKKFSTELNSQLWKIMGELEDSSSPTSFLQQTPTAEERFAASRAAAGFDDTLQAAGDAKGHTYKSYSSKATGIVGKLDALHHGFLCDLETEAHKESNAQKNFDKRMSNLMTRRTSLADRLERNRDRDGNAMDSLRKMLGQNQKDKASAEAQKGATEAAKAADTEFLENLINKCNVAHAAYQARSNERSDEVSAIQKAVDILNGDEVRALFHKTTLFLQTRSTGKLASKTQSLSRKLMALYKRTGDKALQAIALQLKQAPGAVKQVDKANDSIYTKIIGMVEDLIATLKKEAIEEHATRETCLEDLHQNAMDTKDETHNKEVAENKIAALEALIEKENGKIEKQKADKKESMQQLQVAGFDRAEANKEFQTTVHDQKLTQQTLQSAIKVLAEFYEKSEKFEEVTSVEGGGVHGSGANATLDTAAANATSMGLPTYFLQRNATDTPAPLLRDAPKDSTMAEADTVTDDPDTRAGFANSDRPPTAAEANTAYSANSGGAGVIELLEAIITSAEKMIQDANAAEQEDQKAYEALLADANSFIDACDTAISNSETTIAGARADETTQLREKGEAETQLTTLGTEKKATEKNCDFLLTNYEARTSMREEEVEALQEALGELRGATFQSITLV